jgi:GMP synthase PP-ATPase subunit
VRKTASEDDVVSSVIKGTRAILSSETLLIEAVQDLVKDEVKRAMREKLDANSQLKDELRLAVQELLQAKAHEAYAVLKIGKVGAKIGIEMVPPELRKEIGRELVTMFEKEVNKMLEQS